MDIQLIINILRVILPVVGASGAVMFYVLKSKIKESLIQELEKTHKKECPAQRNNEEFSKINVTLVEMNKNLIEIKVSLAKNDTKIENLENRVARLENKE